MSFDPVADRYAQSVNHAIDMLPVEHAFYLEAKGLALRHAIPSLDKLPSDFRCLELGCGTGNLLRHLAGIFPNLVGMDPSGQSLARIPAPLRERVAQFDGLHFPLGDATFDFIVASCVFHHIVPEERPAVLAECRRVLKPNGTMAIIEHNPFHPLTRLAVSRCDFDRDASLLSPRLSRRILHEAGFTADQTHYILFHPFRLSPRLSRWQHSCLRRLPFGAQYLCFASR